jgi:integrase
MKKRAHGEGTIFHSDAQDLWVAEITLPDGKRRRKYHKTQKVVKDWLLDQRRLVQDGTSMGSGRMTVAEYIDHYMQDVAAHTLRPKTIEGYNDLIRLHIKPAIGSVKLSALTPSHVQKFYSDQLNLGLSRRTVQFMHAVLHKSLDQAVRWGMLPRNVCDLVKAPQPERRAMNVWTAEQVKIFLDYVHFHRWYPIYVLAVTCGFRIGEVLGIHYEDIDLANSSINVRHATQTLIGQGIVITTPKTERSRRLVTVPASAMQILKDYLDYSKVSQGLIFTTRSGKPVSSRNIVHHFKASLREAGLPEIRFHDLRHTSATLLLSAGVHPKIVQERLGHSQISLTLDTYSHVMPSMQVEAAQKMDDLLV